MPDMMSSKLSEVAKNQVWREHLKKELAATILMDEDKVVVDPARLNVQPDKPCNMRGVRDEVKWPREKLEEFARSMEPVDARNKRRFPITAKEEAEWFSGKQLVERVPMFEHGLIGCDITKYADKYFELQGTTPFSNTGAQPAK